ncbi:hypothetical protein [Rhodopirellula sp. SWK7]|uniref:hypothetical protein n=1 Tax=Rhodopirellula sp. SWK7 TaxID=595460 RepID=UPI0002C0391D|nr:hypothetical protein [Rhodopirellula sp. SWK7]EMI46031.1 signal peptide protein [Rhodopirellula sp. SWK7]
MNFRPANTILAISTHTLMCVLVVALSATSGSAQPPAAPAPSEPAPPPADSQGEMKAGQASPTGREARLAAYLSGSTFTGQFTIEGNAKADPKPESYQIASCEPLAEKDMYRLKVKIRYGDVDGEFPMDLKILWSGSTPVITLDGVWIPGLGTFSSRVLIHDGRYAGTWQHDAKGGHLFGTIEPAVQSAPAE